MKPSDWRDRKFEETGDIAYLINGELLERERTMKTLLEWLEENRGVLKDGVYEVSCLGNIFCNDELVNDDGCVLTTDKYEVKNGNITLVTNKYSRVCKGITIDVYDVLKAFEVTDPALQHLVKKALCAGLRGYKTMQQDLQEVLESAKRAVELNK